jgi:hypothetical protein
MRNSSTFNTPTTEHFIIPPISLLSRIFFVYLPPSPLDMLYERKKEVGLQGEQKVSKFMDKIWKIHLRVQEQLEKSQ